MKTELFYFSGSGNSLFIAQKISNKIEDSKLIPIPQTINNNIDIAGDIVGIVCPIYFHNIPQIVRTFISKIKSAKYLFIVYAGNGNLGLCKKRTLKAFRSNKLKLNSFFSIPMPDNSTQYGEITKAEINQRFSKAEIKIDKIVKIVKQRNVYFDKNTIGFFKTYINPGIIFNFIYKSIGKMDKDFHVNEKCIGCRTCHDICPINNISIINNKPIWSKTNQCQACLACYNWCAQNAIEHPQTKKDIKKYHNPNILVKDIIDSSMGKAL